MGSAGSRRRPGSRLARTLSARRRIVVVVVALAVVVVGLVAAIAVRTNPAPPTASLDRARAVFAGDDPVIVTVLGDSTGNDVGEWVDLWAKHLGEDHQVTLRQWNAQTQAYRPEPIAYGDAGPQVTIWNGSQSGARAAFVGPIVGDLLPEQPDLVLYSFGHNNVSENIGNELDSTMQTVAARWGDVASVIIVQNPGQGKQKARQAKTLRALAQWASIHHRPTVDVTSAFDDPARQMMDDAHPNAVGSRRWADAVAEAIA